MSRMMRLLLLMVVNKMMITLNMLIVDDNETVFADESRYIEGTDTG